MKIAVSSASPSVSRTLETLVSLSGHHFTKHETEADFLLIDSIHPTKNAPKAAMPAITLVPTLQASEQMLGCPLRPERLLMRLTMLTNTQSVTLGNGWALDMQARQLQHASAGNAPLTEKECALLRHLHAAQPATLTRENLLEQVWGMAGDIDSHTLETHIYRLRSKLGELSPVPCDILTENGRYGLVFASETR